MADQDGQRSGAQAVIAFGGKGLQGGEGTIAQFHEMGVGVILRGLVGGLEGL